MLNEIAFTAAGLLNGDAYTDFRRQSDCLIMRFLSTLFVLDILMCVSW